jgi:hypothetical protein
MRRISLAALACAALALGACSRRPSGSAAVHSPLFTGKEPRRKVEITLPSAQGAGFVSLSRDIYATASVVAQAKQALDDLMAGPLQGEAAVPCFAKGASYLEVYLDAKGLAVVDLPSATVAALPGGTSAEVATLYCLVKTLESAVPGVSRVQVLIDGQVAESLRGHFDIADPLVLSDF